MADPRQAWLSALDDVESRTVREVIAYMDKGFAGLDAAAADITDLTEHFVKRYKNTRWIDISRGERDELLEKIGKRLSSVTGEIVGIQDEVAVATIRGLNAASGNIGIDIGKAIINQRWLEDRRYQMRVSASLWEMETRQTIYHAYQGAWKTGDFTGIDKRIRRAAGIPEDLRPYWRESVQWAKQQGKGGHSLLKAASKRYHEQFGRQASAAYRVERIVRTEAAEVYDTLYDDYEKALGDDVAATEFLPEGDACPDCESLAGIYKGAVPEIPVHPNCRCTKRPIIEGFEEIPQDRVKNLSHLRKRSGERYVSYKRQERPAAGALRIRRK